jgi:hypothetical protein
MAFAVISILVIGVVTALVWALFARRSPKAPRRDISPGGAGSDDNDAARIVFKICPDCREPVLLDVSVCRYCGCALAVAQQPAPDARPAERSAN